MSKKATIESFLQKNLNLEIKEAFEKFNQENPSICNATYFNCIHKLFVENPAQVIVEEVDNTPKVIRPLLTSIFEINNQFDDSLLVPIKGGVILDDIISLQGGVMPATVTVVPGESGAGKTTLLLAYFAEIAKANPGVRLLYVSSEMNAIHVYKYSKRIDMTNVNIMLLSESNSPKEDFEEILKQGWDIVILDSLADTINKVRLEADWTEKATESWVLKYMDTVRRGGNDLKKFTAFLCTQHMTKGKEYAGSTNLKHMTDAMMNLLVDEKSPTETYVEYTKNRDGKKNIKLYFYINDTGLHFNEERFKRDNDIREKIDITRDAMTSNGNKFEEFFLTQTSNESLENPNPEISLELVPIESSTEEISVLA